MATESMFDAPSLWWVIGTSEINFLLLPSALHQQCCKECCLMQHGSSMTWTAWQNCLDTVFKLKKIAFSHFCLFVWFVLFSPLSAAQGDLTLFSQCGLFCWSWTLQYQPDSIWTQTLLRQHVSQLGQHHASGKREQRACHGGGAEKAVQIATRANGTK